MGIIHQGANDQPNILRYIATNYPKTEVLYILFFIVFQKIKKIQLKKSKDCKRRIWTKKTCSSYSYFSIS